MAQRIFLRISACSDDAAGAQLAKCEHHIREAGLSEPDAVLLRKHLNGFLSEIAALDVQEMEISSQSGPNAQALRKSIRSGKEQVVKNRIDLLHKELSANGARQLDAFINDIKAKISFIPANGGKQ